MRISEFNLAREITRIAGLEEYEIVIPEVIADSLCARGDHWLAEGKVLEDARRRVYFGKDVSVIWNDSEITGVNRFHDLDTIPHAEIIHVLLEPTFPHRGHHLFEK